MEELTSFWNLYQSGMLNQKGGPPVREEYREKSANRILLDEKYFRSKQGKIGEIRFMLGLEETVKAVLNRSKTPSSTPGYEM